MRLVTFGAVVITFGVVLGVMGSKERLANAEIRETRIAPGQVVPRGNPSPTANPLQLPAPAPVRNPVERWSQILVRTPGSAYRPEQIVNWSNYNLPIDESRKLHGQSRKWGHASLEVQAECIEIVVNELKADRFSADDIAFAIALCRLESGFNPDAAAGTTSASGLAQFIKQTRLNLCGTLGIQSKDPFDVQVQSRCLASLLKSHLRNAEKLVGRSDVEYYYAVAYGYHHDGKAPSKEIVNLAKRQLIPFMRAARLSLEQP